MTAFPVSGVRLGRLREEINDEQIASLFTLVFQLLQTLSTATATEYWQVIYFFS